MSRLINEVKIFRKRGSVERGLVQRSLDVDYYGIGRELESLAEDVQIAIVLVLDWLVSQETQISREHRLDVVVKSISVSEFLSYFSRISGTKLSWDSVGLVLSQANLVYPYDVTYKDANEVFIKLSEPIVDKIRKLYCTAVSLDNESKDKVESAGLLPAVSEVSEDVSEDTEDTGTVSELETVESVFELPARATDSWPHILRDERLKGVLPILVRQWVRKDGKEVCDTLRIATDGYIGLDGKPMTPDEPITVDWLLKTGADQIIPRCFKSAVDQKARTKANAEVFTPLPTVEKMVNYAQSMYMNGSDSWQKLIKGRALEVACGEGPFITSRYDPADGTIKDFDNRVGVLDNKFKALENAPVSTMQNWLTRAICSTCAVEYQGDNTLLARANMFLSCYEAYERFMDVDLSGHSMFPVARAITKLIVQADVLTGLLPTTDYVSLMGIYVDKQSMSYRKTRLLGVFAGEDIDGVEEKIYSE